MPEEKAKEKSININKEDWRELKIVSAVVDKPMKEVLARIIQDIRNNGEISRRYEDLLEPEGTVL